MNEGLDIQEMLNKGQLVVFLYLLVENINLLNYLYSSTEITMRSYSPGGTRLQGSLQEDGQIQKGNNIWEAALFAGLSLGEFTSESSKPSEDNKPALWWMFISTGQNFLGFQIFNFPEKP